MYNESVILALMALAVIGTIIHRLAFTVVVWSESKDSAVLVELDAIPDQHITIDDDRVVVPDWATHLCGAMAYSVTATLAQMTSPSMRAESELDVSNLSLVPIPPDPYNYEQFWDGKRLLESDEGLGFLMANGAGVSEQMTGVAWLEGEREPVPDGEVETIRCTGATTLEGFTWGAVPLVFTQQLRAGRYAIVGARFESAGVIVGRLIIPGSTYRPGAPGSLTGACRDWDEFRKGGLGVWGEFTHSHPPQAEFLSLSADTAEVVYLDIIWLGKSSG